MDRNYKPVTNITDALKEIQKWGMKAVLFDASMKQMNPQSQIKSFRLIKFQIRKQNANTNDTRKTYDLHLHYVPIRRNGTLIECIEPIVKVGAKTISYEEAGVDEYELNTLIHEFFSSMLHFNKNKVIGTIKNAKVNHQGNQPPNVENRYVYELNQEQEEYVKDRMIRYILACESNKNSIDLFNVGEAMNLRREIIAKNLNI